MRDPWIYRRLLGVVVAAAGLTGLAVLTVGGVARPDPIPTPIICCKRTSTP
jgi:hypothetical protein